MKEKTQSIAKSASLVTLMMLGFKVLGFLKQAVIAYVYGATFETDTYFIAWGFISGVSEAIIKALLVSLVAVYTSLRVTKGNKEAAKLINGLLEILLPLFVLISSVIFIGAPLFSRILAPSYDAEELVTLSTFIRILAPVLIFGCFELILGAVSDSYKSFFVPRLQSLIYSLSVILACVVLSSICGLKALVIAQYVSSFVFVILLILSTKKYHKYALVKFKEIPELKGILYTAIPLFIGNSALQINQIVDKSITSGLGDGAASALAYCHTLEQFVTNIMIVNIGNVMFANFAEFVAKGDLARVKETLNKAIDLLVAVLSGISVVTILCSQDIVSIVYYRGSFTMEAVTLTSIALVGYAISFVAVAVRDLTVKSLYAFKDTRSPMIACIISIVVNITFSLILSRFIGILGVSVATSISAVFGMIINAKFFVSHLKEYNYRGHFITFIRCLPASGVLAVFCLVVRKLMLRPIFEFAVSASLGLIIYFFICCICRVDSIREMFTLIKGRFIRKNTSV